MNIIKLLPESVANQIAAGEVVQRPASAVKELLENSIDSGADLIQVYIKESGKTLIHIVDNGCGMSNKDAEICFKRHATSKIKKSRDLTKINTMGFRGEAMAAISSISHVEIKTKLTNEEVGTNIIIEGGKIIQKIDCICPNGTSIKMKNLFYNVPARRNFLKSEKVEMRHITEEFIRIALAYPSIKMQLSHNSNEVFHLEKTNLRKRIVKIIGGRKNESLVPINEKTSLVEIKGFIGKPESAKKTRGEQYLFVNNRFIKNNYLNHAITKAFENIIPSNYFPSYFIKLIINPELIDINIHPTKTEVKFENEKEIYAILRATIKRSLGQYNIAPSLDFSQEISFNNIYTKNREIKEPEIKINKLYNPFNENQEKNKDYDYVEKKLFQEEDLSLKEDLHTIQIGKRFIAFGSNEGLVLIHQSRAHKRILFEYFESLLNKKEGESQQLLFPQVLKFNNYNMALIFEIQHKLEKIGFSFDKNNHEEISIVGIPPECKNANLQLILEDILEKYKQEDKIEISLNKKISISLSNNLSINNPKKLNREEMISLKNELLKCKDPLICPLGERIVMNLKNSDLEKYF